ncbi:MAG TPA: DUF3187 family protein [Patescibacteria group bacterium]|nr:DUF3187 family protein [Patescibacteria group bacterium]
MSTRSTDVPGAAVRRGRWPVAARGFAAAFVSAIVLMLGAAPALADTELIGPLRLRDTTPFNILRLDMLPAHAVRGGRGSWAIEADLSYTNTFVMSDNVMRYLEARGGGRRPLDAADVAAIENLGGDAYYVDGEFGVLDLTFHVALTSRTSAYSTLPLYTFAGGGLDGTIEGFHNTFGFTNAGREFVAHNRFQTVLALGGLHTTFLQAPLDGGIGDPVLGLRHSWLFGPRWALVLDGAAKLAVVGERTPLSTGANEYGLQTSLQGKFKRQGAYFSAGWVRTDGRVLGVRLGQNNVPTLTAAWEVGLTGHTNGIVQVYASQSTLRDTTVEEIKANKYEASFGVRSHRGHWLYGVAVIENIANFENTPDVGLSLSLAWLSLKPETPRD